MTSYPLLCLSAEILQKILADLSAKTLLNVTETCTQLKEFVVASDYIWERLCNDDFKVSLKYKGPFLSFSAIYQALYKYDIVQRKIYEERCSLTMICDVFKLPDYLYHWCTLLNASSRNWPLSKSILEKGKFMKMWGLSEDDFVDPIPPNGCGRHWLPGCDHWGMDGFIWDDGLELSFQKYAGSLQKFQEVALQRCKKSQKRIEDKFTNAARLARATKLTIYLNKYKNIKNMLTRDGKSIFKEVYFDEEEDEWTLELRLRQPSTTPELPAAKKIGVDYVRGLLHKTGFQQIVNFTTFCNDLWTKYEDVPEFAGDDVKQCSEFVYDELSHKATEKLISPKQFMECAERYPDKMHGNGSVKKVKNTKRATKEKK